MRFRAFQCLGLIVGGMSALGCGETTSTKATPTVAEKKSDANTYVLSVEPTSAKNVVDVRKDSKDGDDVVVVGRIGGDVKPWVEGRAAFTIVDVSLKPCNEKDDDGCKTPWDYCCDTDKLPKSMASIKIVDGEGKTVATDARQLLGVKELQTVVVKGKAKRDDAGNLSILASGLFVRK